MGLQHRHSFLQALDFRCGKISLLLAIGRFQGGEIAFDTGFDLLASALDLVRSEVVIIIIDGFEFIALNGYGRPGQQIQLPAERAKLAADFANSHAIDFAEVGNRFEVRRQASQ